MAEDGRKLQRWLELIVAHYRIALVSDDHEYFHISCIEKMIELPSLAPS